MDAKLQATLTSIFKAEVHDKAKAIDPDNELEWLSLTAGWAIAKGLKPEDAREFASYIRYQTSLG